MAGAVAQARTTLQLLTDDISKSSRDLSVIKGDHSKLLSENEVLRCEKTQLVDEIASLRSGLTQSNGELIRLRQTISESVEIKKSIDEGAQIARQETENLESERGGLLRQIALLEVLLLKLKDEEAGLKLTTERFEKDLHKILDAKLVAENDIRVAKNSLAVITRRHNDVQGAISEAMESFRLFENRIAQFTKDTGYIVGYPRPDVLLEDN